MPVRDHHRNENGGEKRDALVDRYPLTTILDFRKVVWSDDYAEDDERIDKALPGLARDLGIID